ncbi:hypothetical protein NQ317_007898 [Molorchus minor]|uniref:C2H2-type domain-containing protein n=1 Tax=Molorchus minor TaxID=1323400 RepID=A0ABQ9JS68_9CUCU|nr:hypothetical protein NQ317_007898 [Molorchus minor]
MLLHDKTSDLDIFKCDICPFKTKHKANLQVHSLVHKDDAQVEMHRCHVCNYKSKHKHSLTRHLIIHGNTADAKIYKCEMCEYYTRQKAYLKKHTMTHIDESEMKMYECDSCKFKTKRIDCLKLHKMRHVSTLDLEMYKCSLCEFETKQKAYLKKHVLVHQDESQVVLYQCDACGFKTKRKHNLRGHMLIHNNRDMEIYKCEMCDFKTKRKSNLKCHFIVHKDAGEVEMHRSLQQQYGVLEETMEQLFPEMVYCQQGFHPTEKSTVCGLCVTLLNSYFNLIKTYQSTEEKIISYCEENGTTSKGLIPIGGLLSFSRKDLFKYTKNSSQADVKIEEITFEDMSVDTKKEKVNVYLYIDMHKLETDSQNDNLKKDVANHKEKPEVKIYKCNVCDFKSVRKQTFSKAPPEVHKEESEVEQYECGSCHFKTKHKGSLRGHVLIHGKSLKMEMFKCEMCRYETKYRNTFKRHLLVHKEDSEKEMYACELCQYKTRDIRYIKKHLFEKAFKGIYWCIKKIPSLKDHVLLHRETSTLEMFKCGMCEYQTKYRGNIKKHVLVHKEDSEVEMYECELCRYKTKHKNNLKAHLMAHRENLKVDGWVDDLVNPDVGLPNHHQGVNAEKITGYCGPIPINALLNCSRNDNVEYTVNPSQRDIKLEEIITEDMPIDTGKEITEYGSNYTNTHKFKTCTQKSEHFLNDCASQKEDDREFLSHRRQGFNYDKKHIICRNGYNMESHLVVPDNGAYECESYLIDHVITLKEEPEGKLYKCGICHYKSIRKQAVQMHLLVHKKDSEATMHECGLCDFRTKYTNTLKRHLLVHKEDSEVQMYECAVCDFRTKHKGSLRVHLRVHRERPAVKMFHCGMCRFTTKYGRSLKRHLLVHKEDSDV